MGATCSKAPYRPDHLNDQKTRLLPTPQIQEKVSTPFSRVCSLNSQNCDFSLAHCYIRAFLSLKFKERTPKALCMCFSLAEMLC